MFSRSSRFGLLGDAHGTLRLIESTSRLTNVADEN
jgi:hypothetical protein